MNMLDQVLHMSDYPRDSIKSRGQAFRSPAPVITHCLFFTSGGIKNCRKMALLVNNLTVLYFLFIERKEKKCQKYYGEWKVVLFKFETEMAQFHHWINSGENYRESEKQPQSCVTTTVFGACKPAVNQYHASLVDYEFCLCSINNKIQEL